MVQAPQHPTKFPVSRAEGAEEMTGWVGWVLFAGILMVTVGFFNILQGFVALLNSAYYDLPRTELAFLQNYAAWGWILLISGAILTAAGYGVMVGKTWARTVGVILAVVNAVSNMAFAAAYPIWTAITIAIDVLVIYALVVHGREARGT
jgi:hypothetical protein